MKRYSAFTLIELLVVISIIGLLSSIVLVSLTTARKQAEFTAVKSFSASIKHALGAYEIGEWNFDNLPDGDCTTIKDASGNGNDGTCFNGVSITSDSINGKAASFSSLNHTYIKVNDSASLKSPTNKITVEVWIKPPIDAVFLNNRSFAGFIKEKVLGKDVSAAIAVVLLEGGLVYKENSIRFELGKDFENNEMLSFSLAGVGGVAMLAPNIKLGEWNHLVGTYDGSKMILYLNAKQLGNAFAVSGNIAWQPGDVYIGTRDPAGADADFFSGNIDEVRMYNYSVTSAQVRELYSQGVNDRKIAGK